MWTSGRRHAADHSLLQQASEDCMLPAGWRVWGWHLSRHVARQHWSYVRVSGHGDVGRGGKSHFRRNPCISVVQEISSSLHGGFPETVSVVHFALGEHFSLSSVWRCMSVKTLWIHRVRSALTVTNIKRKRSNYLLWLVWITVQRATRSTVKFIY